MSLLRFLKFTCRFWKSQNPPSVRLQIATKDFHNANESVCDYITARQEMRTEEYFEKIFRSVEQQLGAASAVALQLRPPPQSKRKSPCSQVISL